MTAFAPVVPLRTFHFAHRSNHQHNCNFTYHHCATSFPTRRRRLLPSSSSSKQPPRRPSSSQSIRVPRQHTSRSRGWQWKGTRSVSWRTIFTMDQRTFLKVLESLAASCVDSTLLARVTALGARMLRRLSDAFERAWYPDVEKELVVDYGLTEPSPQDKMYVDPLSDWEVSNVNYYRDSFGRRVYLQLEGASATLSASDFRDIYDVAPVSEDDVDDHLATESDAVNDAHKSKFVYMEHDAAFEHELPNGFFPPPALYDAGVHPPPPPLQSDPDAP